MIVDCKCKESSVTVRTVNQIGHLTSVASLIQIQLRNRQSIKVQILIIAPVYLQNVCSFGQKESRLMSIINLFKKKQVKLTEYCIIRPAVGTGDPIVSS